MRRSVMTIWSQWLLVVGLLAAVALVSGCKDELDVKTEERRLKKALSSGEKLDQAMAEIKSKSSDREELAKYGSELQELYLKGSEFDRDILRYLVLIEDAEYAEAYIKAVKSGDPLQVRPGAGAIGNLKLKEGTPALVEAFNTTADADIKEAILEAAGLIKSDDMRDLAAGLLREKEPGDVPIAQLRKACVALQTQADASTVDVLLKAMFFSDEVGRDIHKECSQALMAIGKPAIPSTLELLKFQNESVNSYISRHSDRRTRENIILGAVTLLAKLRAADAREPILDYLADPKVIQPPDALAVKAADDPQWFEWAGLIGQVVQETIFALNDIGVEGNEKAKTVLLGIYKWEEPYPAKFERATDYVNMVEVSARVNAARVLAENRFLEDEETLMLILNTLKDPGFDNIRKLRPAARAAIATDLVTYLGIVAKPDWKEKVWSFFNEMSKAEFADDPKAKIKFELAPTRDRIAKMESTFDLAAECGDSMACYAKLIESTDDEKDHFRKVKAAYELGRSGVHDPYFDLLLNNFDSFDAFGYMFVADALIRLGTAEDIPKVKAKLAKLEQELGTQSLSTIKGYLEPLMVTLANK